ncbi:TPA: transaldolase [Candidatus Bathyarchaeota archaeon]|nr:transaldolase [Candidatus Bathyarchaeota archaeon]
MKIFIDTADINEIKEACSWGIIDGATTNPSLIKKAVEKKGGKVSMEDYIREILETVPGPVSLEVVATDAKGMIKQAKTLHRKFSSYGEVVIKIPVNPSLETGEALDFDGLKAIRVLSREEIPTNATLIMSPEQALLAAKAGATYASPFAGRIDDYIRSKMGMKAGVDFQKGDYFEITLARKIIEDRIIRILQKSKDEVSQIYKNREINKLFNLCQDDGVYNGVDLVAKILKIYHAYNYQTQVIASSIRNARQVREVAELGVDIATLPFNVLREMIQHPKTAEGMRIFTADVVPSYKKIFEE